MTERDVQCHSCEKDMITDLKPEICCHAIDCECRGEDRRKYTCPECFWKDNFDPKKLEVKTTYNGEELEEYQFEWLQEHHSQLIEEIIC